MEEISNENSRATILPSHLELGVRFWDTFDRCETEVSAKWVVRFCLERDNTWRPFTYDEFVEWAQGAGHRGTFRLNGLLEHFDGLRERDGKIWVTERFVLRVFGSAGRFHLGEVLPKEAV